MTSVDVRDGLVQRMAAYYRNNDGSSFSQSGDESGTVRFTSLSYDETQRTSALRYTITNIHPYTASYLVKSWIISRKSLLGNFGIGGAVRMRGADAGYDGVVRAYNVPPGVSVPLEQFPNGNMGTTRPFGAQMIVYEAGTPWGDGPENASGSVRPNGGGRHDPTNPYEDIFMGGDLYFQSPDAHGRAAFGIGLLNPLDDTAAYVMKIQITRSDGKVFSSGTHSSKCSAHSSCRINVAIEGDPKFAFDYNSHTPPPLFMIQISGVKRTVTFDE